MVFCAVIAVTTDAAYTPIADIVFISACMPAPPLESEPAIVNAIGYFISPVIKFNKKAYEKVEKFTIPVSALSVSGSEGMISAVRHPFVRLQR